MEFKQYPSYKNSGVEWLGDVPEHWITLKNRHLFKFSKGLSITKENLQESGIPCVSYGEIHSKFGFEFNPEIDDMKFVSPEYLETSKNCLLDSGDFIFADTSEDFEGSGNFSYLNSKSQVFAGYHTVICRLKYKQNPRFFAYVFDSNAHRKQIQTQVKGIKVFSITQGLLKDIYSWIPEQKEQIAITKFLDTETARIDNLISKQEKLIELLEEQRKSIISYAVTKGLNPNAPMKDSGVEWLGEVPEHWQILKLRQLVKLESGSALPLDRINPDGKYPVYGGNNIRGFTENFNMKGDYILVGRQGSLCGNINYASGEFWATEHAVVVYPKKPVSLTFLGELLRTMNLNQYSIASAQAGLSVDRISNIYTIYIPFEEQIQIAKKIDHENLKVDKLISKQQSLIEKLKEYRASIISHAVTGKIDVRKWVA